MLNEFIPSALQLSPVDNNYLTSRLRYQQFTQNSEELSLSDDVGALETPTIQTMGDGILRLSGSVTVTEAAPTANMIIATLPQKYVIPRDNFFPVLVKRGSSLVSNGLWMDSLQGAIQSVTVTTPGTYTVIPTVSTTGPGSGATFATTMFAKTLTVATPQSGAGSYVPGNTITLTGGTFTSAAVLTVTHTLVQSATVAAGGSGGTDGTQTVTGTTGTGTKFTASVTVAGGAITAVLSITAGGDYTVNPTILTNEPVTGASLAGAQLNINMGVRTATFLSGGVYSVLPSNPLAQGSTSGSGTGATFNLTGYGINAIAVTAAGNDYDETSAIALSGSGGGAAVMHLTEGQPPVLKLMAAATQNDVVYLDGIQFPVNSYT